jgi:hypothetical protein
MITIEKITKYGEFGEFYFITPEIKSAGVYQLFDKNDNLIYIGHSQNIYNRLNCHCRNENANWVKSKIILVENKEHRLMLESLLIGYLKPINNKRNDYNLKEWNINEKKLIKMQKSLTESVLLIDEVKRHLYNKGIPDNIKIKAMNLQYKLHKLSLMVSSYVEFASIH